MTTKASIIVKATSVDADGDVTPYSYKLANGRMVEQAAFPYYVYAEELQYVLRRIASEASDVTCSVYTKYSPAFPEAGWSVVRAGVMMCARPDTPSLETARAASTSDATYSA
jgi:hypothetical protein